MVPLELRNRRESLNWRPQELYEPFRPTLFSSTASATQQPAPLYRTERDVNPTRVATVQRFYDANHATDVGGALLERAGNAVTTLKSATPRFQPQPSGTSGPGAYSPEKFHGAFAATLQRATPAAARIDKLRAKRAFDATFAIVPSASTGLHPPTSGRVVRGSAAVRTLTLSGMKPRWLQNRVSPDSRADSEPVEIESSSRRLAVALTPRNAYSNAANRQLVLAMRRQEQREQPDIIHRAIPPTASP